MQHKSGRSSSKPSEKPVRSSRSSAPSRASGRSGSPGPTPTEREGLTEEGLGLTPEELGYIGGFTDGEGCIRFQGTARVSITNTELKILEWLQRLFGGNLRQTRARDDRARTQFQWELSGPSARAFLQLVTPLLREKQAQAKIVLNLPSIAPQERGPLLAELKRLKRIDSADHNSI